MRCPSERWRLGTRGSPLALWQAEWVARQLKAEDSGLEIEIVKVRTLAEKFPESEVAEIGVGIFTRELDEALLRGDIDFAVHSLKDIPTEVDPRLEITAVPTRESPFDAFISADGTTLAHLPRGARIGTGSPRRRAQLLCARPDLEIMPLRGNVATRLRKMEEERLAGTILAHAGLKRLDEERRITEVLSCSIILPAVSQGALAVVACRDAPRLISSLKRLDHPPSRTCVMSERAFLRRLRGGCQVPAGALGTLRAGQTLHLQGIVAALDGSTRVRGELTGPVEAAEELGIRLANDLLERGGREILAALGRT